MKKSRLFTYSGLDDYKLHAQRALRRTLKNERQHGMRILRETIGESVQVWEQGGRYHAIVLEGTGTEPLAADGCDPFERNPEKYFGVGISSIAVIANDFGTCGWGPGVYVSYAAVQSGAWMDYKRRSQMLLNGQAHACNEIGCCWVGGETPGLRGIIEHGTIDIAGAMYGMLEGEPIRERIAAGDRIIILHSRGIHDNGFTDCRELAQKLPRGYKTRIQPGLTYGDALLIPTTLYVGVVSEMMRIGVPIHYAANITGHGWMKLMRAKRQFSYVIERIPQPQPIFPFLQEKLNLTHREMFQKFNMGGGFALIVPPKAEVLDTVRQVCKKHRIDWTDAGPVERGKRAVHIVPLGIDYAGSELNIR